MKSDERRVWDEAKAAEIRATREKEGTERPERSEHPEKPERPASRPSTDQVGFRFATVFAIVFAWGKYVKIRENTWNTWNYVKIRENTKESKESKENSKNSKNSKNSGIRWVLVLAHRVAPEHSLSPGMRVASRHRRATGARFILSICVTLTSWYILIHLDTSWYILYFSMCTVYICVLFFIIFLCVPCVLWIFMGFQRFLQQNKAHALSRRGSGGSWRRMVSLKPAVSAWSNKTESLRSVIFARVWALERAWGHRDMLGHGAGDFPLCCFHSSVRSC